MINFIIKNKNKNKICDTIKDNHICFKKNIKNRNFNIVKFKNILHFTCTNSNNAYYSNRLSKQDIILKMRLCVINIKLVIIC